LTREAVFDALHARRCYATTGVPIELEFELNGHPMGSELTDLKPCKAPELYVRCRGSNGLDHLRIVRNGRLVATILCHGAPEVEHLWVDEQHETSGPRTYYVRVVQVDRESAWSSPIWVG
jgi:hypothetical protein